MSEQQATLKKNGETIVRLYESGEGSVSIGNTYGCSGRLVVQYLRSVGCHIRKQGACKERIQMTKLLEKHTKEITKLYQDGQSLRSIATLYGCSKGLISRRLIFSEIPLRDSRKPRTKNINDHFFDIIDTQEKAYIFGFMMADGTVSCNSNEIGIKITDRDLLIDIANAMSFSGEIYKRKRRRETWKDVFCMEWCSADMHVALKRLGCTPRKTWSANFPTDTHVAPHLHSHLIRGWLDGDGGIYSKTQKQGSKQWCVKVAGTQPVCLGIANCLFRHTGVKGLVYVAKDSKRHTTYTTNVHSLPKIKIVLDWLYHDATVFLKRKHDKYLEFLEDAAARLSQARNNKFLPSSVDSPAPEIH